MLVPESPVTKYRTLAPNIKWVIFKPQVPPPAVDKAIKLNPPEEKLWDFLRSVSVPLQKNP